MPQMYTSQDIDQGLREAGRTLKDATIQREETKTLRSIAQDFYNTTRDQMPDFQGEHWMDELEPKRTQRMDARQLADTLSQGCEQLAQRVRSTDDDVRHQFAQQISPVIGEIQQLTGATAAQDRPTSKRTAAGQPGTRRSESDRY